MNFGITANGSRLCAGGDLEHESFNSAQKPNRITAVQFITDAPLAQNRCYKLAAVDYQLKKSPPASVFSKPFRNGIVKRSRNVAACL